MVMSPLPLPRCKAELPFICPQIIFLKLRGMPEVLFQDLLDRSASAVSLSFRIFANFDLILCKLCVSRMRSSLLLESPPMPHLFTCLLCLLCWVCAGEWPTTVRHTGGRALVLLPQPCLSWCRPALGSLVSAPSPGPSLPMLRPASQQLWRWPVPGLLAHSIAPMTPEPISGAVTEGLRYAVLSCGTPMPITGCQAQGQPGSWLHWARRPAPRRGLAPGRD